MKTKLLKKIPLKTVLKIGGVAALGVSSVMSAMDSDEKTQVFVKKLAEKSMSFLEKQES